MSRIMRTARLVTVLAAVLTAAAASPAAAQQSEAELTSWQVPGWSITPGLAFGAARDSNVALLDSGVTGAAEADTQFGIEPFGSLEFFSQRTNFSTGYRGYLRRYTKIDQLNGFDQRFSTRLSHQATRRLTVFVSNHFADVPTTDEVQLNGIPFMRAGSRTNDFSGGAETRLSKFTDLSVRYDLTWVDFDNEETSLRGGFVHGVGTKLKHRLGPRLTTGAESSVRFANLNEGTRSLRFIDGGGLLAYQAGPHTVLTASGGISYLSDEAFSQTRTAPYFRAGVVHDLEAATVGVDYGRSFVPAFGFGGANQSQELIGFVHMPIPSNRAYVQGSVAWRNTVGWLNDLELDTVMARSLVGYAFARWLRLEGSYSYSRQDSTITGGEVDRHRIGAQVVIAQPMRIH